MAMPSTFLEDILIGKEALGLGKRQDLFPKRTEPFHSDVSSNRFPHDVANRFVLLLTELLQIIPQLVRQSDGECFHGKTS